MTYSTSDLMIFSGNASYLLSKRIAKSLQVDMGRATVGKFSDGEINIEIHEHVRGKDVFIVQSTSAPVNDHLIELLTMVDALKRASARRITAVMPYFGYARQDRRVRSARVPITARLVANMLTTAGVNRVLTVDLHSEQIQGFFDIAVDNIYALPILLGDIWQQQYDDLVVVSPDVGGVVRARAAATRLDCDLAIIDKRRPRVNEAQVVNIIGDIDGRTCVIIDDLIDTAGTLCKAAIALKEKGAKKVYAYCTHPVLSGKAIENVSQSCINEVIVTDTICLPEKVSTVCFRQLSVADMLAETVRRIHCEEPVSSLFSE